MTKLDPEFRRITIMERRAFKGQLEHRAPLKYLRRLARTACRLHGLPPVTVTVRSVRGQGGGYLDGHIVLDPGCGRNALSLAHELAHHFTDHLHPHAREHGPAFMRWYAHFLDAWRLVPVEGVLAACRHYGVAIAPVLRSTP